MSGRGPRLAAEVLQIRRNQNADPRHVDDAGHPEDVRAIVWQPPVRVREVVGIAAEHVGGATVLSCAPSAVVPLDACSPSTRENVYDPDACHPFDIRFSIATTSP